MITRGIILAGGTGSRLYPATRTACKQLLPVYDKPLIYYPLATLMQAGVRNILIISTPVDIPRFKDLFGDGSTLGISITYAVQPNPDGIAQALIIGESFIDGQSVALILGDNIFDGPTDFRAIFDQFESGAIIFGCAVAEPHRYGVLGFASDGHVSSIEEKPLLPKSKYAVTGLYLYDRQAVTIAKSLKPSNRNELEITDVNRAYHELGDLRVIILDPRHAWLDSGTHESMLEAVQYVAETQRKHGKALACIEEIALNCGYITTAQAKALALQMGGNAYQQYLLHAIEHFE